MSKTVVEGILELVTSLDCGGESVYTVDLEDSNGENLYSLLREYHGEKVRITVEEIE